jgi:hypothetical protein
MFLLSKLPTPFFAGVRIVEADENKCTVSIPYKWFNRNPFRSAYFASLSMAAEMSTGVFPIMFSYKRKTPISMLVTRMEANYFKKAVGITYFTCNDGKLVYDAIEEAIRSGEPGSVQLRSIGTNSKGENIAEFYFTWSFKSKSAKV